MPIPIRSNFDAPQLRVFARKTKDAPQLRVFARKTKDGPQARWLLALAAIYNGATRTEAAEHWGVANLYSLMQQLGPERAPAPKH